MKYKLYRTAALALFSILSTFTLTTLASTASAKDTPPNIVLIISDDQAWNDYGFMGHKTIKTPHIDKLAKNSLLFDRGYVASPLCRPSLASMLTGQQAAVHGIAGNDVDGSNKRAELDVPLRQGFHKLPTFVKTLTTNGYLAHQSGKWWEGSYQDGGFTHGMTHGAPEKHGRHGDAGLSIGRTGMEPVTDFIDDSIKQKKPFLVWYAPFLPHTPHTPPKRLLEKYTAPDRAMDIAKYYAMCEWFDETCGTLLDHIDSKGKAIKENTIILYICDNGWAAASTRADDPAQKKWRGFAQRSKCSPFENGVRTPIMVSWPGKITPKNSSDFAHAIDLYPTILAATGLKAPAGTKLPGINLMDPTRTSARKAVFGETHSTHNMTIGNPDETLQYLWGREGKWKLILRRNGKDTTGYKVLHTWDTAPQRLYDLEADPHEKNEISAKHPEIVAALKKKIQQWHQSQAQYK